ncbi:MAG: hypothetical protein ACPGSM_06390 [Thiolinea sp.]
MRHPDIGLNDQFDLYRAIRYALRMARFVSSSLKGFISDHWYGRVPYWLAIFINLFTLRLLIGLIEHPGYRLLSIPLITLSSIILIWQVTGALRTSDRHFKDYGDTSLLWFAYAVVGISISLAVIHTLDISAGPPAKITSESLRTRPLPTLSQNDTVVHLHGELDFTHNTDLAYLLAKHRSIQTVLLESNGGLVFAARALALNIRKHNLNTHVEKHCNSACPIVFMAGNQRTLGPNGKIGFHQYKLERLQPLQIKSIEAEQEKDRLYYLERGISKQFLERVYQSKHEQIWQPAPLTLLEAGVIHQHNSKNLSGK